jgi:hypothetical protein
MNINTNYPTIKMSIVITIAITIIINVVNAQEVYFKTSGTKFLNKNNGGEWVEFPKFAGVNLGITSPGYQPGEVILEYQDYMRRFERLSILGSHVIRVYSLLQPGFYKAVLDWNAKSKHTIYVLQGTAFPELAMEENNGTDAFDTHITNVMHGYINNTVKGVYGGGRVLYKHTDAGTTPIYGEYKSDISKYLIGWVISGEISPHCINKTNNNGINRPAYKGTFVSSTPESSSFEIWVAELFDLVAKESMKFNHQSPISHTNWVTTDGLTHLIEPRINNKEYSSVEDWMEFDLHHFDFSKWYPGTFYNQHAYPYYPEFLKINGPDSFIDYLRTIRNYYNDLPLIITEIGLPTSVGISSADRTHGRNHGHNGEAQQGDMMSDMMNQIVVELDIYGVIVFQLHDEWFKKAWNTLKYDKTRQNWKNMLTSEQYFGIFETSSHPDYSISQASNTNEYYSVSITNNYEYVELKVIVNENYKYQDTSKIVIGIDMSPGGIVDTPEGSFKNKIDSYFVITKDSVDFKISSEYNAFNSNYGLWLQPESFPDLAWKELWQNNADIRNECFRNNKCEYLDQYKKRITFDDFKLLVKTPTIGNWNDTECINGTLSTSGSTVDIWGMDQCEIINGTTFYEAQIYNVVFNTPDKVDDKNLAMVSRNGNEVVIKIPYQMLGYSDPSTHTKYFFTGLGRDFNVSEKIYKSDINFEVYYSFNDIQFETSQLTVPFNWEDWTIPEYYMIKPKNGFNAFRNIFHELNGFERVPNRNLTQEELDLMTWYSKDPNAVIINLHYYIVVSSIFFIIFTTFMASIGKFIMQYIGYCYSSQGYTIHSPRLTWINLFISIGLTILFFNIDITFSTVSISYLSYIFIIIWDSLIILIIMSFVRWNLFRENNETFDSNKHAFIIACHNSSDVLPDTLKSLLEKASGSQIYVADNGSSVKEQEATKILCRENGVNYGFMSIGNKTIAQYGSVLALDKQIEFVTCIDDDTRLDHTWNVHKVIKYFVNDADIAVLAYPLTVHKPEYDIEWFQAMEYMIVGYVKIFHSKIYSTIFNSGAFGTYRVNILKEAFLYHNTDYHGDDLQICMHIHQLKGRAFHNQENKVHSQNYKVVTATDMIVSTIVPKCWIHMSSVSKHFNNKCDCGNPDLFAQRSKGWFVSMHRFIPRYIKLISNPNGFNGGLWIRMIALYELVLILNEYFAIFYIIFFLKNFGFWLLEGFIIGYAFNVFTMSIFNWFILRPNNLYVPFEVITIQPIIYKIFMISIYRYAGLFYNLFVYSFKHTSGTPIIKRQDDQVFLKAVSEMYSPEEMV